MGVGLIEPTLASTNDLLDTIRVCSLPVHDDRRMLMCTEVNVRQARIRRTGTELCWYL